MRKGKQFQIVRRYESPTVAFIATAVERGFAMSDIWEGDFDNGSPDFDLDFDSEELMNLGF